MDFRALMLLGGGGGVVWVPHTASAGCSKPLGLGIIPFTCYRSTDNLLIRYAQDLIETLLI